MVVGGRDANWLGAPGADQQAAVDVISALPAQHRRLDIERRQLRPRQAFAHVVLGMAVSPAGMKGVAVHMVRCSLDGEDQEPSRSQRAPRTRQRILQRRLPRFCQAVASVGFSYATAGSALR